VTPSFSPSGGSAQLGDQPGPYFGNVHAECGECDGGWSVIGGEQAEGDVLGADEVVAEGERLPQSLLKRPLRDHGERQMPTRSTTSAQPAPTAL
jgi:hypothetical protein